MWQEAFMTGQKTNGMKRGYRKFHKSQAAHRARIVDINAGENIIGMYRCRNEKLEDKVELFLIVSSKIA